MAETEIAISDSGGIGGATDAPATAPITESASAPAATESAPQTEQAPVAEAAPSLLGTDTTEKPEGDTKADEAKSETKQEDKKPEEAAKDKPSDTESDAKPDTESSPAPTFDAFKLPENFQADEKAMGEFTGLLGQLETAKGDHKSTQEIGQKLVDLFTTQLTEATQKMTDYYVSLHNQEKQKMADELRKDPYFGGGGDLAKQTKIQLELKNFLQRNVPKEDLNSFRKFVDEKGVGDALPLAKVINHLKAKIDRYENEGTQIVAATKPAPSKPSHPGKGILNTLYGGNRS